MGKGTNPPLPASGKKAAPPGPPGDACPTPFSFGRQSAASADFSDVDLICLSHLRWDFVYQRPQHLMTRCAKQRRVYFFEEPIFGGDTAHLEISLRENKLRVVVPHLPHGLDPEQVEDSQRELLHQLLRDENIKKYVFWAYTPMALGFAEGLEPAAYVYDCMDELSLFRGAPPILREREQELFRRADLVFTGGQSLYEAKRQQHARAYPFPSSIDVEHFAQARHGIEDPEDQAPIPHPRMGFYGVLDERFDKELLAGIAELRPDWHFVMVGPIVKIDPSELPQRANIHYLPSKTYKELPAYLGNWDVALLLFAHNDSTRFISPTKTPEYLAAGKPVVSTSIQDVVRPYGDQGLVKIADEPQAFVDAISECLALNDETWLPRVDAFLATNSWDLTWRQMWSLISEVLAGKADSTSVQDEYMNAI